MMIKTKGSNIMLVMRRAGMWGGRESDEVEEEENERVESMIFSFSLLSKFMPKSSSFKFLFLLVLPSIGHILSSSFCQTT